MTLYKINVHKRKFSPLDCLSSTPYSFQNTIICALHMQAGVDVPTRENSYFCLKSALHMSANISTKKNFANLIYDNT